MQHVWLVRHAQTEWSEAGRHTGRTDVPLLASAKAVAATLGDCLRRVVPDPVLVLTSPLSRAAETCRLAGYGARAEMCHDLVEWDYGKYEGLTTAEIRAQRPGWTLFRDGVPDGETPGDVGRRADRVVERARGVDGDVLLFSHGHLLRVLAARWVGLPPIGGRLFGLRAGAISALGWERETPVVLRWDVAVDEALGVAPHGADASEGS
jgi:broad specificity phosphatase PhoE